jgi:hypothetical protein
MTWNGARRWSAVLGLTAALAMGFPIVACGSHDETGPTTTTTTTTTSSTPTTLPWGRPKKPPAPPSGTPSRTPGWHTTTTTTPGGPAIPQPITPGPGDLVPFGRHWLGQPTAAATTAH